MKFSELDLPSDILGALEKMGFEEMTPVQEAAYPIIAGGHDLCALAETGSGKTAACAIPLIEKVDSELNEIQGLVIVPTRELCIQYVTEMQHIARKTNIVPFAVYGGFDKDIDIAKLKHGVHILVATPGRLLDYLYSGVISFKHVKCAILDEADELLKVGFLEDIEFILSCIIREHQTLLFSATMPEDIKKLAHDCLRDPRHISLITERKAPESIDHYFAYQHPKDKHAELVKYLKEEDVKQALIFCNARHVVDKMYDSIRKEFENVGYIHAGLSQDKRTSVFRQFKNMKIRYLFASDVAGRGLDFSHVSHVVNWSLPRGRELYTHRTGRTGR
ncbi:MAG: DEAD/DEAH box helicase, partial [Candidatus Scalindua sp.]|nr:DEAD/DEAH box helicase [Candidatus Scalindua sp.]